MTLQPLPPLEKGVPSADGGGFDSWKVIPIVQVELIHIHFLHLTYPQTMITAASVESMNRRRFPGLADIKEPFQHI